MAHYKIKYLDQNGDKASLTKEADSREQAMSISGIPSAFIISVSEDWLGSLKSQFLEKKIPLIDQSLILVALSSKVSSGKPFGRAVEESVEYEKIGVTKASLDVCQTPKDYLSQLRFDDTAILLAEAGSKSGTLPETLEIASKLITDRLEAEKEFSKILIQGVMYSALGILAMIGMPFFAGEKINEFIHVQKLPLKLNQLSELILFLLDFYKSYWMLVLGGIVGCYVYRAKIWQAVKTFPVLSFFNERSKIKRALDFITTYQILFTSGSTSVESLKFIQSRSKGIDTKIYQDAIDIVSTGAGLPAIFNGEFWPPIVLQNMQGFEDQSPDNRTKILNNLAKALKSYYIVYSGKIAKAASTTGFLLLVSSVLTFAIGFYLPLLTISQSLKHT